MSPERPRHHVVVVGGGFAGVGCVRRLAKHDDVRVTLIDRNNYHQFQPLLYQVATSQLAPSDIAFSLRKLFRDDDNVDVKLGEVASRRPGGAHGDDGGRRADRAATRSSWPPARSRTSSARRARTSTPSRSTRSTTRTRLRSRILAVFEDADRDPSLIDQGALNFVVVGGGPTGVELAGALADLIARHDDRRVPRPRGHGGADPPRRPRAHAARRRSPTRAHDYVAKVLGRKGVRLHLGVAVTEVGPGHVTLADGSTIRTRCVVWGGGIMAPAARRGSRAPAGARRAHRRRARTSPSTARPASTPSATSRTSRAPTAHTHPQLGSVALQSGVVGGEQHPRRRRRQARASRSTTTTRASWP